MVRGLFLFSNDSRLHDNPALHSAVQQCGTLLCVAGKWLSPQYLTPYDRPVVFGKNREYFFRQALKALYDSLAEVEHPLLCLESINMQSVSELIHRFGITHVFRSEHAGFNENAVWQSIAANHPNLEFQTVASHTLFDRSNLPFEIDDLPASFSKFRSKVEGLPIPNPMPDIEELPDSPLHSQEIRAPNACGQATMFKGGEYEALLHLNHYFSGSFPLSYKQTRNDLDGWDYSTKFSPWLASGCLSARTIVERLKQFEIKFGRNESTEWILFELLWREYFQWYAHHHGDALFTFEGIKQQRPNTLYNPSSLTSWKNGETPYPIINACMNQLKETGFLSNRGRQLVASCLVNELGLDWRYGALHFESLLVDYDVASNWGNWQYLAGVGADPRPKRHFNIEKQTQMYDPDNLYTNRWLGDSQ
ncbi:DASH family cryptochrome [Vibrio sp. SCSIO 43135]|uniref:DASH family cryptochrome n=1 Tax=Vibrio sp. SCSIO 43135 TaxID=2819096 RepID=UPI00207633AB|nr:DASH family cryptochrome [Vibrio sp. SCSIO 43135]USD42848.1 DASH family cryptochrome [Vibrio sp. SCSIO 43135]